MDAHALPDPAGFPARLATAGPAATEALGARIAGLAPVGTVILLYGPLGAGKTCFCQGFCRAAGVAGEVVSPTFTLVNTYPGRTTVHHLDFYRIEPQHDLDDIGVPAILDEVWEGRAIALVEWPGPLLPALGDGPRLELLVLPGATADERVWHLRGVPSLPDGWAQHGGVGPC